MSRENALREEICDVGRSLYQRGYTVGSAGNISARLDDGWLITPTDICPVSYTHLTLPTKA